MGDARRRVCPVRGPLVDAPSPETATEEKGLEVNGQAINENLPSHNHEGLPRPLISFQFIPSEAELLYREVLEASSEGRPPMEGILKLRELADREFPDVDAIVYLYQFSLQSGQTDKAEQRLNQLIALADGQKNSAVALYHLSWIYANGLLAAKENQEQQTIWGKAHGASASIENVGGKRSIWISRSVVLLRSNDDWDVQSI